MRAGYPIVLDLHGWPVLVVGGGRVAARHVHGLLLAGARVTVVAPEANGTVLAWAERGRLVLHRRRVEEGDVAQARLVFADSSDPDVNRAVVAWAEAQGVPACASYPAGIGRFSVPEVIRHGILTIAIDTAGEAPQVAQRIRDGIAALYGPEWGEFARLVGALRRLWLRRGWPAAGLRAFAESDVPDLLAAGRRAEVARRLREARQGRTGYDEAEDRDPA